MSDSGQEEDDEDDDQEKPDDDQESPSLDLETFECKFPTAFGLHKARCVEFYAIVTAINGSQKSDMSGFGPLHYWMPGYFNAIKGLPLAVSLDGGSSVPFSTCSGGPWGCASSTLSKERVDGQQQPMWDGADAKYKNPTDAGVAFAMLHQVKCMDLAGLIKAGFVIRGKDAGARDMWPQSADFCVVKGAYLKTAALAENWNGGPPCLGSLCAKEKANGDPELNPESGTGETRHGYLTTDRAAALFMGPQVYPFSMASKGKGYRFTNSDDFKMDISDFLYTGARPGHNTEDMMYPFRELEYLQSPADRFAPDPKLYG